MPARIEVDLRKLNKAIKRANKAGIDLRPAFRKLRTPLRKDQAEHMRAMQGPRGKWQALSSATREKRMRVGGRAGKFTKKGRLRKPAQRKLARILSKRLLTKAKIKVRPKAISITSQVKWAGVHQKGGRVGKGARVPKRPFMFISDELGIRASAQFALHLAAAFEGRKL